MKVYWTYRTKYSPDGMRNHERMWLNRNPDGVVVVFHRAWDFSVCREKLGPAEGSYEAAAAYVLQGLAEFVR